MPQVYGRPSTQAASIKRHLDQVFAGAAHDAGIIPASWKRSANYGVDPGSDVQPRILTTHELKDHRQPLDMLVAAAQEELDRLFPIVRELDYIVLLCDKNGVVVDYRCDNKDAAHFVHWGVCAGGIWSEEAEGTNGVGTCISELRPVTVHKAQHFRARHIGLSCSAAPFFGSSGDLIGVLDVSSINPDLSGQSYALAGALVEASARAIGERLFREQFRRETILAVKASDGTPMLFAVDGDRQIAGLDRNARRLIARDNRRVKDGISLWSLFEWDPAAFRHRHNGDFFIQVVPAGSGEHWPALVTLPENSAGVWHSPERSAWHTRPRLDTIRRQRQMSSPPQVRGGLPPQTLRQVHEYVEAHLEDIASVDVLAATAGLSLCHFARAFKESEGVAPHRYLLRRRISRAQELLRRTDLPLSEIALASGFADQSHFSHRFHEEVGVSPSTFRRSRARQLTPAHAKCGD
jgi:AraC-like DNA-binding protein